MQPKAFEYGLYLYTLLSPTVLKGQPYIANIALEYHFQLGNTMQCYGGFKENVLSSGSAALHCTTLSECK